jgi:hypothetical protein
MYRRRIAGRDRRPEREKKLHKVGVSACSGQPKWAEVLKSPFSPEVRPGLRQQRHDLVVPRPLFTFVRQSRVQCSLPAASATLHVRMHAGVEQRSHRARISGLRGRQKCSVAH